MPDLDLQATSRASPRDPRPGWLRRIGDRAVLSLHRLADRMDLIPDDFGRDAAVDEADGGSLAREWLRQARLWAGYNPEQLLALKVGGVLLGGALLALIVLIRSLT